MKKIILVMLIILTSLSLSNDLDKYESKRVFDKYIDVILIRDFEKYKDDPEMTRALISVKEDIEWYKYFQHLNTYEVLKVKENKNKSTLTIKIISENKFREIKVYMDKVNGKWSITDDKDNDVFSTKINKDLIITLMLPFIETITEFKGFENTLCRFM